MGVFKNQGPSHGPQNRRALLVRTPKDWTPNLQKQPEKEGVELGSGRFRADVRLFRGSFQERKASVFFARGLGAAFGLI